MKFLIAWFSLKSKLILAVTLTCLWLVGCAKPQTSQELVSSSWSDGVLRALIVRNNNEIPSDILQLSHTAGARLIGCEVVLQEYKLPADLELKQSMLTPVSSRSVIKQRGPADCMIPMLAGDKVIPAIDAEGAIPSAAKRRALKGGCIQDAATWSCQRNLQKAPGYARFLVDAEARFSAGRILKSTPDVDTHSIVSVTDDGLFVTAHAYIYRPFANGEFRQLLIYDVAQDLHFLKSLGDKATGSCRIISAAAFDGPIQVLAECGSIDGMHTPTLSVYNLADGSSRPLDLQKPAGPAPAFWDAQRGLVLFLGRSIPSELIASNYGRKNVLETRVSGIAQSRGHRPDG